MISPPFTTVLNCSPMDSKKPSVDVVQFTNYPLRKYLYLIIQISKKKIIIIIDKADVKMSIKLNPAPF